MEGWKAVILGLYLSDVPKKVSNGNQKGG